MPDPAKAPWGEVRVRHTLGNVSEKVCSVYVNGQEVARLPVVEIVWRAVANTQQVAHVELTFLAERTEIDSKTILNTVYEDPQEGDDG
jgi:hypothetical protein